MPKKKVVPSIPVSEISRILVNLRKCYLKINSLYASDDAKDQYLTVISDVRKKLELRRRSREGVAYSKKNV